jgi:BRCT domain type II-containing protein
MSSSLISSNSAIQNTQLAINHSTSKAKSHMAKSSQQASGSSSRIKLPERLYSKITPDQKLSYRYNYDNIQILNERLLKAGVRLGKVC